MSGDGATRREPSGPLPERPEGGCCQPHLAWGPRCPCLPPVSSVWSRHSTNRSDAQAGHQRWGNSPQRFQRPFQSCPPSLELLRGGPSLPAFFFPTNCPEHCRPSCVATARSGRQSCTSHFDSWPGEYFGAEQRARMANSVSSEQPLYPLLLGVTFSGCEGAGFASSRVQPPCIGRCMWV